MTKEKKISIAAGAGMLITAFIWGFAFVVVKSSLDTIPPVYMLAFRFSIATIGLCVVFCKRLKNMTKSTFLHGCMIGAFLFLGYLLQTIGCQYTTAGKNAFLTTIYVILVPVLHHFIDKKNLSRYHLIAGILCLTGIGLLSLQGDMSVNIGDVLTLACGFAFAFQFLFIDRYTEKEDPVLLSIVQIGFSAVVSLVLAPIIEGPFSSLNIGGEGVISMLYLGLFSTMIAFLLQNVCQKYTHPATAAIVLSMESVFGVLCSVVFLGEQMTIRMVIGCVLMFGAILLAELKGSTKGA